MSVNLFYFIFCIKGSSRQSFCSLQYTGGVMLILVFSLPWHNIHLVLVRTVTNKNRQACFGLSFLWSRAYFSPRFGPGGQRSVLWCFSFFLSEVRALVRSFQTEISIRFPPPSLNGSWGDAPLGTSFFKEGNSRCSKDRSDFQTTAWMFIFMVRHSGWKL